MSRPLAVDLFAGLHGWAEGLVVEGWRVVGFDIENMCAQFGVVRPKHVQLVLQDVLMLHGSQFKDAALIVASPPCQEFSYMAMPWTRAKEKAKRYRDGTDDPKRLTALFDACFRIQREACEAAGHHIPLVVENVCGAQKWVGRARWHFGSFYLWGDVPALMPIVTRHVKVGGFNWSDFAKEDYKPKAFNGEAARRLRDDGRKSARGGADGWFGNYALMKEGIKQHGSGREWFAGDGKISRLSSSGSRARKAASAHIAKIPIQLARHIARVWHPGEQPAVLDTAAAVRALGRG
jgi:hypothetical protein